MSVMGSDSDSPGALTVAPVSAPAEAGALRDELRRQSRSVSPVTSTRIRLTLTCASPRTTRGSARSCRPSPATGGSTPAGAPGEPGLLFLSWVVTKPQSVFNLSVLNSCVTWRRPPSDSPGSRSSCALAQEMSRAWKT